MQRVLVISNDRVGTRMAGPAIRYFQFAKGLARRFDVTLVVPEAPDLAIDGVEVVVSDDLGREIAALSRRFDAVVTQVLGVPAMNALARSETRIIYDLYVPFMVENLGFFAGQGPRPRAIEYRATTLVQDIALRTGDAFICASERQRDLWLGYLGALGRIDLDEYVADPSLSGLVRVVPFGVEPVAPADGEPALKGVVPGIGEDDRVLLWGGGIWNWFDPLTPIRAVAALARERDDVKLYFLGIRHPNPKIEEMAMASRAVELSKELGVFERHVFFNFGWVPYGDRHRYLLDADLGISTHLDTIEARFAFRTRMLDYFWAGLPTVATRGDVLAELIEREPLGLVVEPGDADGFAAATVELLDDRERYAEAHANTVAVRDRFGWARAVETLAALIDDSAPTAPPAPAGLATLRFYSALLRIPYHRDGLAGYLGGVKRRLRRS